MNGNGITDFHSHILPRADHGSDSLEVSKKQLELLKRAGSERVVATPHFYPQRDSVESFLARRSKAADALRGIDRGECPQIYLGAEVLVCPGIDHMQGLQSLCIEGTGVILLEMPMTTWRGAEIEAVCKIAASGLIPVMAHIDRYKKSEVEKLSAECGELLYQLNGSAVCGFMAKKRVKELCSSLPVACVGSDIHGADKGAAKNLKSIWTHVERNGISLSECADSLLEGAIKL